MSSRRRGSRSHWPKLYEELRAKLIAARKASGLTQEEAAVRLGRSQGYVAKSETGERRVDVIELAQFAAVYNKSVSSFLPKRLIKANK